MDQETVHFSVRSEREGPIHRLTPVGELDIGTVEILEGAFAALTVENNADVIVVDLTELSFIDCSGLHLLERMDGASVAGRLRVVNGSPSVQRLFDLVGARAYLPVIDRDTDPLAPVRRHRAGSLTVGHTARD